MNILFSFSLDVEKLLSSVIPSFDTNDIKFKRTKQIVDRTSFILTVNDKQANITEGRVKLYISLLVGNDISSTISTIDEQVFLVQCDNEIGKKFYFLEKFCYILLI